MDKAFFAIAADESGFIELSDEDLLISLFICAVSCEDNEVCNSTQHARNKYPERTIFKKENYKK